MCDDFFWYDVIALAGCIAARRMQPPSRAATGWEILLETFPKSIVHSIEKLDHVLAACPSTRAMTSATNRALSSLLCAASLAIFISGRCHTIFFFVSYQGYHTRMYILEHTRTYDTMATLYSRRYAAVVGVKLNTALRRSFLWFKIISWRLIS